MTRNQAATLGSARTRSSPSITGRANILSERDRRMRLSKLTGWISGAGPLMTLSIPWIQIEARQQLRFEVESDLIVRQTRQAALYVKEGFRQIPFGLKTGGQSPLRLTNIARQVDRVLEVF